MSQFELYCYKSSYSSNRSLLLLPVGCRVEVHEWVLGLVE